MIRIGKVSSVDKVKGTCKVVYFDLDNSVTTDLPCLSHIYKMPKVNDLVLVAHRDNAVEHGVIIGSFYNNSNRPKQTDGFRIDFNDTNYISCDIDGNIEINCKTLKINGTEMTKHKHDYNWTDGAGSSTTGEPKNTSESE